MNRCILLFTAILVCGSVGRTQASELLSPAAADRLGLVEAWHRQLGTIGGANSIVDLQVWVQRNSQRELVEIVPADKDGKPVAGGEVYRRIAIDMKDSMGVAIGKKEALRLAELDIRKLKRRGIDATHRSISLKQVRLYLLGDDGGLSTYDAETGELLWSLRIGDPKLGYGTLGICDEYVTVINGTTMHRIIADDRPLSNSIAGGGRPLEPVRLDNVPLIGATNTRSYVVIPDTRSGLDTYNYEPIPGEPGFEMFSGQAMEKPVKFADSTIVGWTTDQGFLYVMETAGEPTTYFRLKTDGNADGGPTAASDDRFFLGSAGGRVYGVKATRIGEVLWNRSYGEPFYRPPYIAGDHVLISSSYGNLFCLNAADGLPVWSAPSRYIDSIFAHAAGHYFGRSSVGMLSVVDPVNGQQIRFGDEVRLRHVVLNSETNRLYLVSNGGTVQCLKPFGADLPTYYGDMKTDDKKPKDAKSAKPRSGEPGNPFGAEDAADANAAPPADPFGAGADAPADPFGAGAPADDPFGAGADAPADDPFGAGEPAGAAMDDPFGG
jgi:outer membrane protein assembly factor BamB